MLDKSMVYTFQKYFSFNTINTHGYAMKLNVNHSRLESTRKFFCNRCIDVWNNKLTTSHDGFKKVIDKINFSNYCRECAFDV